MKNISIVLVTAFLAGFVGCSSLATDPAAPGVTLAADQESYFSSTPVEARLSNASGPAISFSWCDLELERLEIEGWAEFPLPPRACPLMINILEPGDQDATPLVVEGALPPATYRLILPVRADDFTRVTIVTSATFNVVSYVD